MLSAVDINECAASKGNCSQQCINTAGSYTCNCTAGYYLEADAKTCNCKCSRANQIYHVSSAINFSIVVNLCTSRNGGCSHICTSINGSDVLCTCRLGYQLGSDGSTCSGKKKLCNTNTLHKNQLLSLFQDINECLNSEACSLDICTNTNGSYICSCSPGSILSANMKTCTGISPIQPMLAPYIKKSI